MVQWTASILDHFLYPAYLAVGEPYLDAVGVKSRAGENVLYLTLSEPSATLVLLQHNGNLHAGADVFTPLTVHSSPPGHTNHTLFPVFPADLLSLLTPNHPGRILPR